MEGAGRAELDERSVTRVNQNVQHVLRYTYPAMDMARNLPGWIEAQKRGKLPPAYERLLGKHLHCNVCVSLSETIAAAEPRPMNPYTLLMRLMFLYPIRVRVKIP